MAADGHQLGAAALLSWETASGQVVQTSCDIIPDWSDTHESSISDNPVEDGSTITDHVVAMPSTLTLTAAISQTPLYGGTLTDLLRDVPKSRFRPSGLLALTQGAGRLLDAGLDALGFGSPPPSGFQTYDFSDASDDPGNDLHDKLLDCANNAYLCKLDLGVNRNSIRSYEGYVIQSITKTITEGDGEKSTFALNLRKIHIVQTELAALPIPSPLAVAASLAASVIKGKKPATNIPDPDSAEAKAKRKSLLLSGVEDLF